MRPVYGKRAGIAWRLTGTVAEQFRDSSAVHAPRGSIFM